MKRRALIAGATGALAVAVVAVMVAGGLDGGKAGPGGVQPGQEETIAQAPQGASGAFAPSDRTATGGAVGGAGRASTGAGGVSPALPQVAELKIVRNATLDMEVTDVIKAARQVEEIAVNAGGLVASSSVFVQPPQPPPVGEGQPPEGAPAASSGQAPQRTQTASVTIRVPSSQYTAVMDQLRGLAAEAPGESSNISDVTEEYTDLQARLRNLEATEARYLELLAKAETIPDILTLQDRINGVRLEIEQVQGRINLLNDLTDLATITVQLRPFVAAEEPPAEPGWAQEVAEGAWEKSQDVMRALATAGIVGGVVLAWLAVPALAVAVAWRLLAPRRERKGEAPESSTLA